MIPAVSDLRCWLALAQTPGVGARTFQALLKAGIGLAELFEQPASVLYDLGLSNRVIEALRRPDWKSVERTLAWAVQPNCHILTLTDPAYPPQLQEIASPPPVLFVHGQPRQLHRAQLAVVGSRNPSSVGQKLAFEFAKALAELGLVITSGLATGIDGAAHRGALAGGTTVAVVGTGPDRVYPSQHKNLAAEIVTRGAIVSEFPPGTPVRAKHFPRRNRIIAGLSLGTLVVEATHRSGSLITARFALEQGREVMAIPGAIHNPQAKGCNALIREGAKLVETIEDILEALNLITPPHSAPDAQLPSSCPPNNELSDDYQDLLSKIDYCPIPVDRLVEITGLTPADLASMLLVLELEGYITAVPGGCYQRIR